MISRIFLSIQAIFVATTLMGVTAEASQPANSEDEKVVVELYYEAQCPGCREMVTTSFNEAFQKDGFLDMATVEFVPYGNAQETKTASGTYEFECQHGPSECIYNTIEACALEKIQCPIMAFKYIDCIERSDESRDPKQDYYEVAMACCKLTGLDDETIDAMEKCAVGAEGNKLEHMAAAKTEALDPPHEYVPYVVVNGVHDENAQDSISDSLFDYVCDTYTGSNKSSVCKAKTSLRATSGIISAPLDESKLCFRADDAPAVLLAIEE